MMFDCLAFGEVMLRFDPGDTRIATAETFKVWEGGGEYNVARGLRRLLTAVWIWIVAVGVYWLGVAPAGDWRPWAALLVSLFVGALAWRSGPLTRSGVLVWDGARWWWERPSSPVVAVCCWSLIET